MNVFLRPVRSSIGAKYVTALTGLALIVFVLGHMGGNLLIFLGPDWLNSYAQHLKEHPTLLWGVRSGLLTVFLIHMGVALYLAARNRAARPVRYVCEDTVRASWASRHMVLTGALLLAFILYHLAHFTLGVVHDAHPGEGVSLNYFKLREEYDKETDSWKEVRVADPLEAKPPAGSGAAAHVQHRHDVYRMVVYGFRNPLITGSYLLAMVILWLHLWHGGTSWLQSLGWTGPRYAWLVRSVGPVLATVVFIGNCSIPLAVLTRLVGGNVP